MIGKRTQPRLDPAKCPHYGATVELTPDLRFVRHCASCGWVSKPWGTSREQYKPELNPYRRIGDQKDD